MWVKLTKVRDGVEVIAASVGSRDDGVTVLKFLDGRLVLISHLNTHTHTQGPC